MTTPEDPRSVVYDRDRLRKLPGDDGRYIEQLISELPKPLDHGPQVDLFKMLLSEKPPLAKAAAEAIVNGYLRFAATTVRETMGMLRDHDHATTTGRITADLRRLGRRDLTFGERMADAVIAMHNTLSSWAMKESLEKRSRANDWGEIENEFMSRAAWYIEGALLDAVATVDQPAHKVTPDAVWLGIRVDRLIHANPNLPYQRFGVETIAALAAGTPESVLALLNENVEVDLDSVDPASIAVSDSAFEAASVGDVVETSDLGRQVARLFGTGEGCLAPNESKVIRLRFFERQTQKEVAAELGVTLSAVRSSERSGWANLRSPARKRAIEEYGESSGGLFRGSPAGMPEELATACGLIIAAGMGRVRDRDRKTPRTLLVNALAGKKAHTSAIAEAIRREPGLVLLLLAGNEDEQFAGFLSEVGGRRSGPEIIEAIETEQRRFARARRALSDLSAMDGAGDGLPDRAALDALRGSKKEDRPPAMVRVQELIRTCYGDDWHVAALLSERQPYGDPEMRRRVLASPRLRAHLERNASIRNAFRGPGRARVVAARGVDAIQLGQTQGLRERGPESEPPAAATSSRATRAHVRGRQTTVAVPNESDAADAGGPAVPAEGSRRRGKSGVPEAVTPTIPCHADDEASTRGTGASPASDEAKQGPSVPKPDPPTRRGPTIPGRSA